jgi:hypothetical protein
VGGGNQTRSRLRETFPDHFRPCSLPSDHANYKLFRMVLITKAFELYTSLFLPQESGIR